MQRAAHKAGPVDDFTGRLRELGLRSISYTYTEPTIFFEFAYECAKRAHEKGIKNVFVSNGYTSPEATRTIAPYLDGNNIDLKGSDEYLPKNMRREG